MRNVIFIISFFFGMGTSALLSDRRGHIAIAIVCYAAIAYLLYLLYKWRKEDRFENETIRDSLRFYGQDIDLSKLPVIARDEEKIVYEWNGHEITQVFEEPGKLYWRVIRK